MQVDGRNYLLPKDAALADDASVGTEALDVDQLLRALSAQPRVSLFFLDACRNNPLAANLARKAGAARSLAVSQGLAQIGATAANTLIAYSTQPGAVAADGTGRNSPFTAALLRHIGAPGLDVQETMRRVRASVIQTTGGVQAPWDNSSLTSAFYFTAPVPGRSPPPPDWTPPRRDPTPRQLDIALWNDVKDKSAGEIQSYLTRYPNGVFAETAKARLAALAAAATADRDRNRQMAQDIAREFAAIAGRGTLVAEPKEPQDFYANARLYELRGDFLNARRSYPGFFNFGLQYVDPHYRFQTFLKVQEGRAGAGAVYGELAASRRADEVMQYTAALLQEPEQRKARLEQIIAAKPDFAPAFFELARNYSEAALGSQTITDKEKEKELLTRFVALADSGKYLKWFIDQTVASQQLDDARQRLRALAATAVARRVSMDVSRNNQGWGLSFEIPEDIQELFLQFPGRARESTGFETRVDATTGKPVPKLQYEIPGSSSAMTIQASYRDATGVMRGPFSLAFDPDSALYAGMKNQLGITRTSWIALRKFDGRTLVYFTTMLTAYCAIAEIRYGYDTMTPNRTFTVPPCNKADPTSLPSNTEIYLEGPGNLRFVSAQIRYKDGTQSAVERFDQFMN